MPSASKHFPNVSADEKYWQNSLPENVQGALAQNKEQGNPSRRL